MIRQPETDPEARSTCALIYLAVFQKRASDGPFGKAGYGKGMPLWEGDAS